MEREPSAAASWKTLVADWLVPRLGALGLRTGPRLDATRRLILETVAKAGADRGELVRDSEIAERTDLEADRLRSWLLLLMREGLVDLVRTRSGHSVALTDGGRRALDWGRPSGPSPGTVLAPTAASGVGRRVILLVAANPRGMDPLRLDEKARGIDEALERSTHRDEFQLVMKWAATPDDLRHAVLTHRPEIVHFVGHGTSEGPVPGTRSLDPDGEATASGGLAFVDDQGAAKVVSAEALARLFGLCTDHVRCVILNACYSQVQAEAIAQKIPCVIGMSQAIGDEAAIKFSQGFYDALGAGKDYAAAFEFGRASIDLDGIAEHLTPVILGPKP
jgi:hypothetical protein